MVEGSRNGIVLPSMKDNEMVSISYNQNKNHCKRIGLHQYQSLMESV